MTTVLPAGAEAVTGAAITKETQSEVRKSLAFFHTFMLVFAVMALLVGGFMIFNTFSITVAQRTRENGLLRALGASRRQVLASVLLEALAVGVLASLLGLAGGSAVAVGLKALLAAVGFHMPARGVAFTPSTVVVSLAVGVGVTLLAAVSPARKAAKVPPVAAMQQGAVGSTGYGSKQRVFVGLGAAGPGAGRPVHRPVRLGRPGRDSRRRRRAAGLLRRVGPRPHVSLPLSRVIGAPLPRLRGMTGELARENAMRNPKRTAASASALMIGVGLVGFITIFVSSTKASSGRGHRPVLHRRLRRRPPAADMSAGSTRAWPTGWPRCPRSPPPPGCGRASPRRRQSHHRHRR